MSRSIEIQVSEQVTRRIHIDDKVTQSLEILDLVSEEECKASIEEELSEKGYTQDKENGDLWSRKENEVTIEINSRTREVQASVEHEEEISQSKKGSARGYDDTQDLNTRNVESTKSRLAQEINKEIDKKAQTKQNELTQALEQALDGLKPELREISHNTNKKNLQRKARQMGQVESESQTEDGELTIRVKV